MAETEQRAGKVAELAGVLSAEARARIIQLLKERALCVGALAARLEITSAAVSQHLRILKAAGLVEPERRGNFVHYRLNPERLAEVQRRFDRLLSTDEQD
jgi:DNA-binding transcriptional ArsR family regulator